MKTIKANLIRQRKRRIRQGIWGYHPLAFTWAQTGEVLRLINRSGNCPNQDGGALESDRIIALCRRAGFRKIVLRRLDGTEPLDIFNRWLCVALE